MRLQPAHDMTHEPRLTRALRELLSTRRVAALGTLDDHQKAQPFVSMVPFALLRTEGCLVLHVSGLAAHTRNLIAHPQVSLMVMAAEADGEPVHALPRVTLDAVAQLPERDSNLWAAARTAYLLRFPEAEPMTTLGDFMFVLLRPTGARQVAGFGAARNVDAHELAQVLGA
jgi:putative heme iron utilization protein